jgi:hypothetical protein
MRRIFLALLWFIVSYRKFNAAKLFIMLPTSIFVHKMAYGIKTEYQILQIPKRVVYAFFHQCLRQQILKEMKNIQSLKNARDLVSPHKDLGLGSETMRFSTGPQSSEKLPGRLGNGAPKSRRSQIKKCLFIDDN